MDFHDGIKRIQAIPLAGVREKNQDGAMCHRPRNAGCRKWLQYVRRVGGVHSAELSESRAIWCQGIERGACAALVVQ